MKLSISNIAWESAYDFDVYNIMSRFGYSGLEIAPTRVFPENPYAKNSEARKWSENLKKNGLIISSIQSIWFGRQEKLFGTEEERIILMEYTKRAIDFAEAISCKNLVFGCPSNRILLEGSNPKMGINFFKEVGDYAVKHGTVIGIEANPTIYNTNYINDTMAALQLIKQVNSKGFLLNLDVGTMIYNREKVSDLLGNIDLINHVHISEPGLKPIEQRLLHNKLKEVLVAGKYNGFISIEMGKVDDIAILESSLKYVRSIFY